MADCYERQLPRPTEASLRAAAFVKEAVWRPHDGESGQAQRQAAIRCDTLRVVRKEIWRSVCQASRSEDSRAKAQAVLPDVPEELGLGLVRHYYCGRDSVRMVQRRGYARTVQRTGHSSGRCGV